MPNDIPNTQIDPYNNMPHITDAALDRYAIDSAAYPNAANQLAGFSKGKRTLVTYFRLMRQGGTNIRTNIADYISGKNVLDLEYRKILNLEITIPQAFSFEVDNTRASAEIKGEAMMLPYMNPNVGDFFMLGVGDGKTGLFQISSVTPTTWRDAKHWIVKFLLQSFGDPSEYDVLEDAVKERFVFDKQNYLGGHAALLTEQTYLDLNKIRAIRGNLIDYYHQAFFSADVSSYMRPDNVYDAHAVYFFANKVTMDDLHMRPKNLMGHDKQSYNNSIWARLEDRYNTTFAGVWGYADTTTYRKGKLSVFATELVGRRIVVPRKDSVDTEPYIFTAAFWTNSADTMTPLEKAIRAAVVERSCGELSTLISAFLMPVYDLSPLEQYYYIPLYIHLIDMATQSQYRDVDAASTAYASQGV